MFVDPSTAITDALVWIREIAVISGIAIFGWKARDSWQDVKDFSSAVRSHMLKMEGFAQRVESNHMRHMERYLYVIAKDRNKTAIVEPELVAFNDVPPPVEDEADANTI